MIRCEMYRDGIEVYEKDLDDWDNIYGMLYETKLDYDVRIEAIVNKVPHIGKHILPKWVTAA